MANIGNIDSIKITQLTSIGSNIAANSLIPVVNMANLSNPITQKSTLQNAANYILNNANGVLFPPASQAIIALSVANAAQPNITSVGTLSINTLNISGGNNGQFLQTNGNGNLNWADAPGGGGNGSPAGANAQIQYNLSGEFGASANLNFNAGSGTLNTPQLMVGGNANIEGTANVTNLNVIANFSIPSITTGPIVSNSSVTANGFMLANGNITSNGHFIGNGALLTGITATATGAGPNTSVQYNANGVFAGDANFAYDYANHVLNVTTSNIHQLTANTVQANHFAGEGGNLSNIQGANVTGAIALATYAGTANAVAVANVIGIGNISTIALNGSSSNVLYGNGQWGPISSANTGNIGFLGDAIYDLNGIIVENADLSHGSTASLIIPSNGNATVPMSITNTYGNVVVSAGISNTTTSWTFDGTGNLTVPGNINNANVITASVVNTSNINTTFIYANNGIQIAGTSANILMNGGYIIGPSLMQIGNTDNVFVGQNAVLVMTGNSANYIEAALVNQNSTGSGDFTVYADNGNAEAGYVDMGITGSAYNVPNTGLTQPGDGYFIVAGAPTSGGNLIIATAGTGSNNDIVFGNGYDTGNEVMRFENTLQTFQIKPTTGSSNTTTGALTVAGGVGIGGDLNLGGGLTLPNGNISNANVIKANSINVSNNANVSGNLVLASTTQIVSTPGSNGNITLDPDGTGIVKIIGNVSANYIISPAGSNSNITLDPDGTGVVNVIGNVVANNFSGNISITGNINGTSPNVTLVAGSYNYLFDNTGNFTLPANGDIIMSGTGSSITGVQTVNVAGNITASGSAGVITPNRPGFRVYGSSSTIWSTTTNTNGILNANNWTVDYNQGGYLNSSTGVFTAPVAGLYQVNLVARVANNTSLSAQAIVIKNYGSGNVNQVMWESANNPTINHFGVSTVSKLAAGDTLTLKITVGSLIFDGNDNWSVAFLG